MSNRIKSLIILISIILIFSSTPKISSTNIDRPKTELANSNIHTYTTYQEMTYMLSDLQENYPDIMYLESYGQTYEGREVWFVKLSDNVEIEENEPGILLLAACHGDEKITFEIMLFFINHMLENYSRPDTDNDEDGQINEDPIDGQDNDQDGKTDEDPSEERVRQAIDSTQIYILPMINPDGVMANSRKNCNPDPKHGININRNFGYDWINYDLFPAIFDDLGHRQDTSWNYHGPYEYSEVETQAVRRVAESFKINISLSYHSGFEVYFYPWYQSTARTHHEELFIEIGEEMEEISDYPLWIGSTTIIPRFGGTLGTSENYLYGEHNILAYTVESHSQKAPTSSSQVYSTCLKNVGVHLYLCEKAQTVDNSEAKHRSINSPFSYFLAHLSNILQKLLE